MSSVKIVVESRAQQAGLLALADIAALAERTGFGYRIVGGQMVTLLVAVSGIEDPLSRLTLDADLGVEPQVAGDPRLVTALEDLGYTRPAAANRFVRSLAGPDGDGQQLTIDLLMPSYKTGMHVNQHQGDMVLDAIPGLHLALARPGNPVTVRATLLDRTTLTFTTVLPDIQAALCVKVLGWADRGQSKDAVDVWRLLEVYYSSATPHQTWTTSTLRDTVAVLKRDFASPAGRGQRMATTASGDRARIRALAVAVVAAR